MPNILTREEVARAIYVDGDYNEEELDRLSTSASSFIFKKTNYDFAKDKPIEPLAVQCAMLYVKQLHFGADGYNKEFDYSFGISSLILDLQDIALKKVNENDA